MFLPHDINNRYQNDAKLVRSKETTARSITLGQNECHQGEGGGREREGGTGAWYGGGYSRMTVFTHTRPYKRTEFSIYIRVLSRIFEG